MAMRMGVPGREKSKRTGARLSRAQHADCRPRVAGMKEKEGQKPGQTCNHERFGLHSEDKGKLSGNSGPRRATWKQTPRWSSTCGRLIVP